MPLLFAGLALFILIHLIPVAVPLRNRLAGAFGEARYKMAFALFSALAVGLIIYGKSVAEFVPLYEPPGWGRHGAWLMMLVAFVLLASTQGPSALRHYLKHPMLLAVAVWGGGHLLANGDLASIVLFGTMAGFGVLMIFLLLLRDRAGSRVAYSWRSTIVQSLVGAAIYLVIMYAHPFLFGVAVV